MGDRIIVTEDAPKPDTVIVVQKEKPEPKAEKEVVVTETTRIKTQE